MAGDPAAQAAWLHRVLGISVPSGGDAPLIAYRKVLLGFAAAKTRVAGQIDALARGIEANLPEEAALARDLAAELAELNEEIADAVDAALNAAGEERALRDTTTATAIRFYLDHLATDPLVRQVDTNPFVPVSVRATLGDALSAIARHLP